MVFFLPVIDLWANYPLCLHAVVSVVVVVAHCKRTTHDVTGLYECKSVSPW